MMPEPPKYEQQPQALPVINTDWLPAPRIISRSGWSGNVQMMTGIGLIICVNAVNYSTTTAFQGKLYDGQTAMNTAIVQLSAPAAGNCNITPASPGIPFRRGIYMNINTGFVSIAITYIPLIQPLPGW